MGRFGALPRLDGGLGVTVRGFYLVLALWTTITVAGSLLVNGLDSFRNIPADMQWGLRTYSPIDQNLPVYVGQTSAAAAAAGLRENDVFVAIQSKPVGNRITEWGIGHRLNAIDGDTLRIVVRHADASIAKITLKRQAGFWHERDLQSGLPLWLDTALSYLGTEIIPAFLLGASLLLFARRPKDPQAMLFAIAFLFLSNIPESNLWLLVFVGKSPAIYDPLMIGQALLIVAAAGFPNGRFEDVWARILVGAAIPIAILNKLVRHSETVPSVARMGAIVMLVGLSAIALIGLAVRYRRITDPVGRQQIKWVLFGFSITFVASIVYARLIAIDHYVIGFQIVQIVAFLALPAGLVVSLLRYRLYDAEATISRSAAYVALTLSLVCIFAATEKLIEVVGSNILGGNVGAVAGGVSAGVVAVLIAPLHHRIDHWARHRFQRALVRLREGLPALVGDLREVASLDQLARAALARVAEGVPTRHLALVASGEILATREIEPGRVADWLAAAGEHRRITRSDPLFPVRVLLMIEEETPVGELLVGPRPDDSLPSLDEIEALNAVADPLARALMVCREREATQIGLTMQVNALASRVLQIEKELMRLSDNFRTLTTGS